jgi:HPt (histidine-containing phosphotransfer) domain-containing protein
MNWKHSNHQIAFIVLGNCHTTDEAYRVLCELEEDRVFALESSLAENKRAEAKLELAKTIKNDSTSGSVEVLRSEADELETAARKKLASPCFEAAEAELSYIRTLKERIHLKRKYKHLPDTDAHQICQHEEWVLDVIWKAFNSILSSGFIPVDLHTLVSSSPHVNELRRIFDSMSQDIRSVEPKLLTLSKHELLSSLVESDNLLLPETVHNSDLVETTSLLEFKNA